MHCRVTMAASSLRPPLLQEVLAVAAPVLLRLAGGVVRVVYLRATVGTAMINALSHGGTLAVLSLGCVVLLSRLHILLCSTRVSMYY